VRGLDGHMLYDNQRMLQLLRTSGYALEVRWDGGDVLSVQLHIPSEPAVAGVVVPGVIEEVPAMRTTAAGPFEG
jgi:hypothetical protein